MVLKIYNVKKNYIMIAAFFSKFWCWKVMFLQKSLPNVQASSHRFKKRMILTKLMRRNFITSGKTSKGDSFFSPFVGIDQFTYILSSAELISRFLDWSRFHFGRC